MHDLYCDALIEKKIKFSLYIRKFRGSDCNAKSYMRKGFLIYSIRKCANIKSYLRRPLVIYDFATAPV
jgi:hypothetical protein